MSFLRLNASVQGLVLTEFDTAFTNPYFASRFDNSSHVSADSIAATAAVLAAALYRLAGGGQQLQVRSCLQGLGLGFWGLAVGRGGESWC
jgi:hypothetical protein